MIAMTDFGDVFLPRFPRQISALGDETQAADCGRLLDERAPNISDSDQDSLAKVNIAYSEKRKGSPNYLLWMVAESIVASMPSSVLA